MVPTVDPPRGRGVPIGGVVVAGVGVASFALAGVFAGLAQGAREGCTLDGATDTLRCPTPALVTQAERGRGYTVAANAFIVGGARATVGGGVWIAVSMLSRGAPGRARAAHRRAAGARWSARGLRWRRRLRATPARWADH